ncbi:hypothetical protein BEL05_04925 [Shewanella colwelliana]|uniref:Uncharacterized protein n=1 Tax=Shewanella colwelliana TaxID=23 RepID=A0A1E5IP50_SHECO|nr:hypothetical protein [Shewanella colwelliana]OEG72322.1 hypothetical protein BEL05_04925 [Shewanella colwelliana]
MTTKKSVKTPKSTEIQTEMTELDTVLGTESITETTELNTELGTESITETVTKNTELTAFITDSQAKPQGEDSSTPAEEIEKITAAAARVMVANGLTGLLAGSSQLLKLDMNLTPLEVDSFAKDMAPLIVKYGNRIEDMPPWLKALLKHKVELIAVKGVVMLGVSLHFKYKLEREKLELQKQQMEEAKRAAAANETPAQEAA